MLRIRPFCYLLSTRVSSTPVKVYAKLRFVTRRDLSIRAVPARQFLSDGGRVLDNVDEFTPKKSKRQVRQKRDVSKDEVDDWLESSTEGTPEEWGSDGQDDLDGNGSDLQSSESVRNDGYSYYKASSISVLTEEEKERVLPLIPVGRQAAFYAPKELSVKLAWLGGALCGWFLFKSNPWIAGLFLTSPFVVPWILAGLRNWELQSNGSLMVGIWHCQVLNVEFLENSDSDQSESALPKKLIRLLIGDPWKGGIRVEMVVPPTNGEDPPSIGELCDLLVLSNRDDFASFKVVREAFFPKTRLWLAEYPFINRDVFYKIVRAIQKQQNEVLMDQDNW